MSRTKRFAQFLRAAVAVRHKPVLLVEKYPAVLEWSSLPEGLKEVRSPLMTADWPEGEDRWLVVRRVPEPQRPPVPEVCEPWLDSVDLSDPTIVPEIGTAYTRMDDEGREDVVPISPDALATWEQYRDASWLPWSAKVLIARQVQPIYQKLFTILQDLKGRSDAYDLYVGVGLYESRKEPAHVVRRHFLAFPAEISLDERTGTISVGPAADFVRGRVETDFLPVDLRTRIQPVIDGSKGALDELGASLNDLAAVSDLLGKISNSLDATTEYHEGLKASTASPGGAVLSFAPALVFRERNLRSLDALLEQIEASADQDGVEPPGLPTPWRKMIEVGEATGGDGTEGHDSGPVLPGSRVYFPLPSNEEQTRIVRFAQGTAGVVVQGPPGTGKTHTIANLISHYLALGKRVLVTAQTAQALKVLRDKLPMELQQLCVSMLGESKRNDKFLEHSVRTILDRQQTFDAREAAGEIDQLERRLESLEIEIKRQEQVLQEARAKDSEVLEPVPGYRGTKSDIARRIRNEQERLGFIADSVPPTAECPEYPGGWKAFAEYHASLTPELQTRLSKELIDPGAAEGEFARAIQACLDSRKLVETLEQLDVPPLPPTCDRSNVQVALAWLERLGECETRQALGDAGWFDEVRAAMSTGNLVQWHALSEEAAAAERVLSDDLIKDVVEVKVTGRSAEEARRDLTRLDEHFSGGGKPRTLFFFKPAVVKDTEWLGEAVTVEGRALANPADISAARKTSDVLSAIQKAEGIWPTPSRSGTPRQRVAILRHRAALLVDLLALAERLSALPVDIRTWLAEELTKRTPTALLLRGARLTVARRDLESANQHLESLCKGLQAATGRRNVVPALFLLLEALSAADPDGCRKAFLELSEERRLREAHQAYDSCLKVISEHAPSCATTISATAGTQEADAQLGILDEAWRHRQAKSWLAQILSQDAVMSLERSVRADRERAQEVLKQLASAKAWACALDRIGDRERTALVAWSQAVQNIPATGKTVFRRRAAAKAYLEKCLDAIPAWVAPLGRLYETVRVSPGMFDVVIVDEASQCWLDSLIVFYLSKQVIVVGDDKQISPWVVGVDDGQIAGLVDTYLRDFEYGRGFTIDASLFEKAQLYLSRGVPLREHFRCVPEIIRFSNELSYSGNPLIPLRHVGRERLEPLKRSYVPEGIRKGDVNDAEAKAIVEAIAACHKDEAYEEKDFGVVSLQGTQQAKRIEQLLLERLGPDVFEQRNLRCGEPHAFQGDERDVVFLSMMVAPNVSNGTLSGKKFEQRFNVAMSRGKDQAWLFHSIKEADLSPLCLRRRTLGFFSQPPDADINGSELDSATLRLVSERADRRTERPPAPFDSWFEVDVALSLVARGYRLSAQVQVGTKTIDLVVEGDGVRLAVECDGDHWHGPDEYAKDAFRQRQLERAGLRFARVRECVYYADEEAAVREVVAACEELGVTAGWDRQVREEGEHQEYMGAQGAADALNDEAILEDLGDEAVEEDEDEDEDTGGLGGAPAEPPPHDEGRTGPFTGYGAKSYPDPKMAPAETIREAVLDIIKLDGPLPKGSIYRLYREGCPGIQRVSKTLRQKVNKAVAALERAGVVVSRDEGTRKNPTEVVVKLAQSAAWVQIRLHGARDLEDVPLSELAVALERKLQGTRPASARERELLYRDLARTYGVQRYTNRVVARLRPAEEFAFRQLSDSAGPPFQ